jgi:choline dehydrogenase
MRFEEYDYVIVGAGSAGCVLAARLTEDPDIRVLLIEAGGADGDSRVAMPLAWLSAAMSPRYGWGYMGEAEPNVDQRQMPHMRGKLLGGTSSINGMMYVRGSALDYNRWAAAGCTGWSYEQVLPYFRRAEHNWRGASTFHGDSGPLSVSRLPHDPRLYAPLVAAAARLGLRELDDFNGAEQVGVGVPDFTIRRGRRASTSQTYLAMAQGRSNLHVASKMHVERVIVEHGRAVGVMCRQGGKQYQYRTAREVILAAGAFNSPQLLMLSGIGPADDLRAAGITVLHELPGVGRNLQDHPMVALILAPNGPLSFESQLRADRFAWSLLRWRLRGTGPAAGMPFALQGFLRLTGRFQEPDTQLQVSPVSFMARPWFPGWRTGAGHQFSVGSLLLRPESRGRVWLRSSDPAAAPRILCNYLATDNDRSAMRTMLRFMRELFATEPAARLVSSELAPGCAVQSDADLDAYIRATLGSGAHPVGTCAMGIHANAVVDPALRVRGVDGLRIVDASIMPDIPSGNTNAPVIMIAEKAADMLKGLAPLVGRDPLAVAT